MPLPDSTQIGALHVRGPAAGGEAGGGRPAPGLRLALSHLLGSVDWRPPGLAPAAVLIVRRLADPRPHSVAPHRPARRVSPDWERAVRQALADLARRAARPDRGLLPADAEAVLFDDEAEMLACLALDISRHAAGARWWWRVVMSRYAPRAKGPAGVLAAAPDRLPAMLAALAEWGQVNSTLAGIGPHQAETLLASLYRAFDLGDFRTLVTASAPAVSGAAASWPAPPGGGAPGPGVPPDEITPDGAKPDNGGPPPPWRALLSPGDVPAGWPRARTALLAVGLALYRRPAAVRSQAFSQALAAWWARPAAPSGPPPPRSPVPQTKPDAAMSSAPEPDLNLARRLASSPAARPIRPAVPGSGADDDAPAAADLAHRGQLDVPPAATAGDLAQPAAGRAPAPDLAAGAFTELGGVLYLINLMRYLGLPDCFEATWRLASQVGPWGVLELLGRGLLDARHAHLAADPLWPVLAALNGRRSGTLPGLDFAGPPDPTDPACARPPAGWPTLPDAAAGPRPSGLPAGRHPLLHGLNPHLSRWLALVLPDVRWRLAAALPAGSGDAFDLAAVLLLRPGRLLVTRSHVDLVMPLAAISLPVRLAGLDVDPGWLPAWGRVIRFHFETG